MLCLWKKKPPDAALCPNLWKTSASKTLLTSLEYSFYLKFFSCIVKRISIQFLHSRIHSEELSSKYVRETTNVCGAKVDLNTFKKQTKITEYNGSDKSRSHFASFFAKVSSSFSKRIIPISDMNDTAQTTTSKNFLKKLAPRRRKKNKKTNKTLIACAAV